MLHVHFGSSRPDTTAWSADPNLAQAIPLVTRWYDGASSFTFHSSGSTGTPKSITLSREFLKESALRTIRLFQLSSGDALLLALDTSFMGGTMVLLRAIMAETELYSIPASALDEQALQILPPIRLASFVPAQVIRLLESTANDPFQNIQHVLIGGAPVSKTLEDQLLDRKSACAFYQTYGMTETASHVALRKISGTTEPYRALDGYSFSVDECNRLVIHYEGSQPFQLTTNDVVELYDPHSFQWVGRHDWVVNSGGIKFSLEQAEECLIGYFKKNVPWQQFTSYKTIDDTWGEKWVLITVGQLSRDACEALIAHCRKHLGKYVYPKEIRNASSLVFLPSGKIDRKKSYEKSTLYF